MYSKKAYNQKKENDTLVKKHTLKAVDSVELKTVTIVGGWDYIQLSKHDKAVYVLKGKGSMSSPSEHLYLTKGVSFEALCDREIKISGQLQYLCATPTTNKLEMKEEQFKGGWTTVITTTDSVVYVTDGLGFAKINNKTVRLEEGTIFEIPAGSTVEWNGFFHYVQFITK